LRSHPQLENNALHESGQALFNFDFRRAMYEGLPVQVREDQSGLGPEGQSQLSHLWRLVTRLLETSLIETLRCLVRRKELSMRPSATIIAAGIAAIATLGAAIISVSPEFWREREPMARAEESSDAAPASTPPASPAAEVRAPAASKGSSPAAGSEKRIPSRIQSIEGDGNVMIGDGSSNNEINQ
jgi:hypothetical protein